MKKIILIGAVATGLLLSTSCDKGASGDNFGGLKTVSDSLSYFVGNDLMNNVTKGGIGNAVHSGTFIQGLRDAKAGKALLDPKTHGRALSMSVFQSSKGDTTKGEFTVEYTGLNNAKDSLSYLIGADIIENLEKGGMNDQLNEASILKGMQDAFNGDTSLVSKAQGQAIFKVFMDKANLVRKGEGEEYLKKVSEEEGVVTLPSGLRYKILTQGTGVIPTATQTVRTHYHGTTMDGKVFDSSVERGTPAEFPVGGVIKGWIEALQLMPVGSKWKLYIPYNLAYGEFGNQGIAPFETLMFDIELLEIVEPVVQPAQ